MAYKDEYEVARLYTDGRFQHRLREQFGDGGRLTFHLAPPLLAERDSITGPSKKRSYGPWMMTAFRLLARHSRDCAALAFDIRLAGPPNGKWSAA